ncbi:MAG: sulfite exporter TauE/SafE family protein, partial [Planctomycetes bacterium]|nr:sulfite exporter TauE/SafE family protein [Planctomycetota bacterium]
VSRAVAAGADLPPRTYAALLGLLTPLLPCGWLYVFAVVAAGTASPLRGAAVMAAFWLGTVPILFALALGLQAAAQRLRSAAPALGGLLLVGVGALLVADRGRLDYALGGPSASRVEPTSPGAAPLPTRAPCCGGAAPASPAEERVP